MIYALPGMGADNRMYPGPWRSLTNATFLDWPAYKGEDSIEAMGRRVAEEARIPDGAVLIGASLGGMVACEIARIRRVRELFLVGSAKNCLEINGVLNRLHPLIEHTPLEFFQSCAARLPREVTQMFGGSEAAFIRAMCHAVFEWLGLDGSLAKPLRIHGRHDRVIPLPRDVNLVIEGGHLISMTHAQQCVDFVLARLGEAGHDPRP